MISFTVLLLPLVVRRRILTRGAGGFLLFSYMLVAGSPSSAG